MQPTSKRKLCILIIDDDKTILKILVKILQKEGHTVDTAETGRDALNKIQTQQYDVALIDVRLQDINGLDLLKLIQNAAPKMIKIMLTGYPSDQDRITALERGTAEYLAKPVKSEKLIEVIESKLRLDSEGQHQTGNCETPVVPERKTQNHFPPDDLNEV